LPTASPDGLVVDTAPHDDAHGHGTACAGLIRAFAPECELYSIKVLDAQLEGSGEALAAALRWALDHGMQVCNLSLGTTREMLRGPLLRQAVEADPKPGNPTGLVHA
jgi:subtilisin family serine protease